jgi:hypothetical protein
MKEFKAELMAFCKEFVPVFVLVAIGIVFLIFICASMQAILGV